MNTHLPLQWAYKPRLASDEVKKKMHLYDFCSQICLLPSLPCSLFHSALVLKTGGMGIQSKQASLCIACGRQLDWESEKRESERDGEKGERECERCLPCDQTMQFFAGTWWALRQWQLTHSPTHGGFPRLPPVFLAIVLPLCLLPSIPPLLCFGINVKCLINTAASAAVPYDHRSGSTCQVSLMHAHMHRRAQTCSKGHIALLSSHTSVLLPFRASTFQSYQTCNNCH